MLGQWKEKLKHQLFGAHGGKYADEKTRKATQAQVHRQQGNALLAQGAPLDAARQFQQALTFTPNDTQLLMCLGYAQKEAGKLDDAQQSLELGLSLDGSAPMAHEFHYLLGDISATKKEFANARSRFEAALQAKPDFAHACKDLCQVLNDAGQSQQVKPLLERMVKQSPATLDYRLWLADIHEGDLDFAGVARELSAAHGLGMKDAARLSKLGAAHFYMDDAESALRVFDAAMAITPSLAFDKHMAYAGFFLRAGENERAVAELSKAVEISPASSDANNMLLMLLSYTKLSHGVSYKDAAERFEQFLPQAPSRSVREARQASGQRIRLGLVSADFREHPVAHFLKGILRQIDQSRFEVFAYSNNGQNDEETEALKALFPHWQDIRALPDEAAAQLVRADQIDVLVDLSGHTGGNRLSLFTLRPALTQISWLGYFASTGLRCMDYILVDSASVPAESTEWFSEKVYRLPNTRLCMTVPAQAAQLPVAPSPHGRNGFVTFGSFQQLAKISEEVLGIWAQILSSHTDARLRLQAPGLEKDKTREYLKQRLVRAGIDLERVEIVPPNTFPSYLKAHEHIDVLLDTFPYTGGTTTAFGLWMGVPTITLAGETMLARQGVMMLHCAGLDAFIARDTSEYLRIAGDLCEKPAALDTIRTRLRSDLSASALFDAKRFTKDFEEALTYMHTH